MGVMATSISRERGTSVRGLGEIALRVNDLDAMHGSTKSLSASR
jgi:hypothetical protein